jgi:hypothetical protein
MESVVLLGKEDYFLDSKEKERGPPNGYRLVVLGLQPGDNSKEDFEDSNTPDFDDDK